VFEQFLCYVFHNIWRWLTHPLCGCCYRTIYVVSDCCLSIFKHCWLTARVLEKCFWGRGKSWNFLWRREWEPCSFVMPTYSCKCCGKCTVYTVVYIAKNGGGYTQRGVAKGLKVPCLFMITLSKKNPEVGIRRIPAYTPPQYTTACTLLDDHCHLRYSSLAVASVSHLLCITRCWNVLLTDVDGRGV